MTKHIIKFCKKCKNNVNHRISVDNRRKNGCIEQCCVCYENNCKRYRKKHWKRYLAYKANSRKRKDSDFITEEHIDTLYKKQNGRCAISGVVLNIEDSENRPSLDRIDSKKGYKINNLQLLTWITNRTKGKLDDDTFIKLCHTISEHNKVQEDT